jgi:hypothetical protein
MTIKSKLRSLCFILLLTLSTGAFSQDNDGDDADPAPVKHKDKFLFGFYVGSYFANNYSASTYNGYGFDINGNRNTFLNSLMYQKIINEYGGGYGQTDYIAQALGVDPHQWTFTESDMPINMHYSTTILVGFNFKLPMGKKNAIIANVNGTKIGLGGNFTMTTLTPPTSANPAYNSNLKVFTITGREQRLQFELGFQHIFGDNDMLNFFAEGGFVGTLAKFDKNMIYINNLQIDLTTYVNQTAYPSPGPTKNPVGFGLGAFLGAGLNIDINPKFTVQLLYTLSQEKVNIGTNPTLKLQNAIGFRVYYNI